MIKIEKTEETKAALLEMQQLTKEMALRFTDIANLVNAILLKYDGATELELQPLLMELKDKMEQIE